MSHSSSSAADSGIMIRRTLFILLLIALTFFNLMITFRGLSSPQAMDQAQIAREFSRGNGFSTKNIAPLTYAEAKKAAGDSTPSFVNFPDTYHAPLNPLINALVFKAIGADKADAWQLNAQAKQYIFPLDRVVATVCTCFFLGAILVTYLLVARIFDGKIAGVTAVLMLFSQTYWDYSMSGLPQMLLLFLFSLAAYFTYRAIENTNEGKPSMMHALVAGVFYTLMALTHWLAVWIALGYIIYAALAYRPRGIMGIGTLLLLLVASAYPMIRAVQVIGSPLGSAYYALWNGLAGQTESLVMRSFDSSEHPLSTQFLILSILRNTINQSLNLIPYLAGLVVAPLFFMALLHPFKRANIAQFRWAILIMWLCAAFGMSLYGLDPRTDIQPNQIHLLFAPLMAAYGLAMLSIMWSKLSAVNEVPMLRNLHHIVVVLVCASPLLLALPQQLRVGMSLRQSGGYPWWPTKPYFAPALNVDLKKATQPNSIIVSDQPWAVAWYADRVSLWLPTSIETFERLESSAENTGSSISGILVTPASIDDGSLREVMSHYRDFASMVMTGRGLMATRFSTSLVHGDKKLERLLKRYANLKPLSEGTGLDMIYFSEKPATTSTQP